MLTKKIKSMSEDQLYDMMWSNEWKIVEQTQKLLVLLAKSTPHIPENITKLQAPLVLEIQDLIDKKYNIIGAQMILDEVKN
tara:strand:+ start:618 stop:860 length:243 start_codon:yes stop_codon:yes gene_type:complete